MYAWHPELRIEFDRDLPRNVSGIYGVERDAASGLTFAWTGADAVVRLPGLDRGAAWTLHMRTRGGRTEGNPALAILADGVVIATRDLAADWTDIEVEIPARPERRGLVLGLRSSTTLVPGASDPRALGVMLDSLTLTPQRIVLVPRPALEAAALAAAPIAAATALLGVTAASAIGGAVLLTAGLAAVLARGFGPFTDYPATAIALGAWIGLALGAVAIALRLRGGQPPRNTARFALAFSAAALFLKLLVLLHPNMPIGDAMFHAHRFQGVLAGQLYFTSTAPGGYLFPYPPGLYVFAAAFAGLVRRGLGDVVLLRVVTATVDTAAALLLYPVAAAVWRNRLAGAVAVAIYHVVPVDFAVLTTGNLTNAFAQSIAVAALAAIGSGRVRLDRRMAARAADRRARGSLPFTYQHGGDPVRGHRGRSGAAGGARRRAASLHRGRGRPCHAWPRRSWRSSIYYAHFLETYQSELARIARETAANASDAGGRTAGGRLAGVPYSMRINLGIARPRAGGVRRPPAVPPARTAIPSASRSAAGQRRACCFW